MLVFNGVCFCTINADRQKILSPGPGKFGENQIFTILKHFFYKKIKYHVLFLKTIRLFLLSISKQIFATHN